MIRLFEEQVQKHGEKAAICDPVSSQTVTYGELEENSRRIAAKLVSVGFGNLWPVCCLLRLLYSAWGWVICPHGIFPSPI